MTNATARQICIDICTKHTKELGDSSLWWCLQTTEPLYSFDSQTRSSVASMKADIERLEEQWNDADPDSTSKSTGRYYADRLTPMEDEVEKYEHERAELRTRLVPIVEDMNRHASIKQIKVSADHVAIRLSYLRTFIFNRHDSTHSTRIQIKW